MTRLAVDLSPEESEAVERLAKLAGCPPTRVVHWAIASYFRLRRQESGKQTAGRVRAPAV